MEKEIWKDIKGYEGVYQVSNLGRVKSLDRIIYCKNGTKAYYKEKILKQSKQKNGYYRVTLSANNKQKKHSIHRLVAQSFLKDYSNELEVNHIDGNPANNKLSNLEMISFENHYKKENQRRTKRRLNNKRYIESRKHTGEITKKRCSKSVTAYNKNTGNKIKTFSSQKEGAEWAGISAMCISDCITGRQLTAGGYIWKR